MTKPTTTWIGRTAGTLAVVGVASALATATGACGKSNGSRMSGDSGRDGAPVGEEEPPGTPPTDPADDVAFFVSGHSLTDDPLAADVVAIATSLGFDAEYNEQIVIGSPIRVRTRGDNPGSSSWPGYSTGKNRSNGSGLNVVSELANHATISGPYDALVLTERHDLIGTILWEDTVPYVRHFHDRLVSGNPQGITYLYHSWLPVSSRSDVAPFIAYERAMFPVWECIAERIQVSLTAEGSSSLIVPLPAGIALADLLERAVAGDVPGLSGGSTSDVVDRLFDDDVHLTRVGIHYMALVTFASIYRRSPEGASAPPGVAAALATELQRIAWQSVSRHHHPTPRGLAGCRAYMRDVACDAFGDYHDPGMVNGCKGAFADANVDGPFRYDAATDEGVWFPDP